jgi:transposase-like protein
MIKATRARYTLEFKQEAVRLVESGLGIAAASRTLGLVKQTLFNWVKAHRDGTLKGGDSRSKVTAEQMETCLLIPSVVTGREFTVLRISKDKQTSRYKRSYNED